MLGVRLFDADVLDQKGAGEVVFHLDQGFGEKLREIVDERVDLQDPSLYVPFLPTLLPGTDPEEKANGLVRSPLRSRAARPDPPRRPQPRRLFSCPSRVPRR